MTKNENVSLCSHESEKELITLAKNGNADAFERLLFDYKNYVGYIVDTVCWGIDGYREDFMQEGFLGLFRAVKTYDGLSSSFSTYAFQCIKNTVITAKRKLDRVPISTEIEDIGSPSAEEIVLDRESTDLLYERMTSGLSAFEREVIDLYVLGLRTSEIAVRVKKEKKSVDNALLRAKRKLGGN